MRGSHPPPPKFECAICGETFKYEEAMDDHIERQHRADSEYEDEDEDEIVCPVCDRRFVYQLALEDHVEREHPGFY